MEPAPSSRPARFTTSRLPACGLVKNLAFMSCISVGSYSAPVIEVEEEWDLESPENLHSSMGAAYSRE
ncbi:DNA-dependent RNA polymerase II [Marasmius sp. AFHP31]|nr:DNA-dependent RNA polymerase II [Marasmius sp. AFHP31]